MNKIKIVLIILVLSAVFPEAEDVKEIELGTKVNFPGFGTNVCLTLLPFF